MLNIFSSKFPNVWTFNQVSKYCRRHISNNTFSRSSRIQSNFALTSSLETAWPDIENKVYENRENLIASLPFIDKFGKQMHDYEEFSQTYDLLLKGITYISTGGKMWRPCSLICTYKLVEKPENLTEEKLRLAYMYAWCTEIIHGVITLTDDIQRNALTRRNKKCFHRLPDLTDNIYAFAQIIEVFVNQIIIEQFKTHPCYEYLLENVSRAKFRSYSGLFNESLMVDYGTNRPIFSSFTMKNYLKILKYNYGYLGIRFPIEAGLALANQHDAGKIENSGLVLDELEKAYQMKADLDDLENTYQKEITDDMRNNIVDSKLTWFAVKTLELANPNQRKIWQEHYGRKKKESILAVLSIYKELQLEQLFQQEENDEIKLLKAKIPNIRNGVPHDVMYTLAESLLKVRLRT